MPGGQAPAAPAEGSTIVLSRALCRYEFVPKPMGLSGAKALRAAQLLGESRAPFSRSDSAVISNKDGHGIWWWDVDRITAALGPSWTYQFDKIVPESLLQPPGNGLRQLELRDGFEGQFWRDGALVLSSWRRHPFSVAQWTAFARAADPALGAEDLTPPQALKLPMAAASSSRARRLAPQDTWRQIERAAGLAIFFLVLTAAALAGRAIGYGSLAEAESGEAARISAPVVATAQAESTLEFGVAQQFSELSGRPSPLVAIAEIHRLLAKRKVQIIDFSVEKARLEVQIDPPPDASLKAIASDVEAAPLFAGVDPEFDNATGLGRITAAVCPPSSANDADRVCLRARQSP